MKRTKILFLALALFPGVASAQGSIQAFFINLITFVNSTIIPFLIGMAFFVFVINIVRFFVIGGSNQEGQEKARSLALYGVLGMVFLVIFWGIINMLTSSIGLAGVAQTPSDYTTRSTGP